MNKLTVKPRLTIRQALIPISPSAIARGAASVLGCGGLGLWFVQSAVTSGHLATLLLPPTWGLPLALMFIPAILRSHRLVIANGQLDWRRPYASTLHIPLSSIGQIGIREKTIYYGRSSKPRKVKVLDILKEDGLVIATLDCKFSVPMDEIAKLLNERSQDCTP